MNELIVFLQRRPDAVARLLERHVPDGHGRCRGCTVPGYGTPSGTWPWVLHRCAEQARCPPMSSSGPVTP
jgi:hypothetical protein